MAVSFFDISESLETLISSASITGVKKVFLEAMERDFVFTNMPMINVRLNDTDLDLVNIPDGYLYDVSLKVDLFTFDLSRFKKAAKVRDGILSDLITLLTDPANRIFDTQLSSSKLVDNIEFNAGVLEGNSGHVASATLTLQGQVEPT